MRVEILWSDNVVGEKDTLPLNHRQYFKVKHFLFLTLWTAIDAINGLGRSWSIPCDVLLGTN